MTPQNLATEAERRKAEDAALRRESERVKNSPDPDSMRLTARGLRERAKSTPNNCDRSAMLRLAAEYERRADDTARRPRLRFRAPTFGVSGESR